jgi:hypothetical protein
MSDKDRAFWLLVRRALIMICKAIETRFLIDNEGEKV